MSVVSIAGFAALALGVALLVVREMGRRSLISYEYRWETFAVRGLRGRQLLHIRRSEIVSIEPLTLGDRLANLGGFKWLARSSFKPKVIVRSNIAHAKPVVVSWEGRLIAGLKPEGYKLRPEEPGPRG